MYRWNRKAIKPVKREAVKTGITYNNSNSKPQELRPQKEKIICMCFVVESLSKYKRLN